MASIMSPSAAISVQRNKVTCFSARRVSTSTSSQFHQFVIDSDRYQELSLKTNAKLSAEADIVEKEVNDYVEKIDYGVVSVHHVGVLCENLERSMEFYQGILGLEINEARPDDKLPYRGAWLWIGSEMIHLMELPNPDPLAGRPSHGGRDRHTCIAIRDVSKLKLILDKAGIPYTLSRSGRPAIFTRDPDANALEFTQVDN
ncbi:Lactoylglutathione lyase / glyoxalase I family protein [Euphorbia peplus]|nr:Lactoylglutathione lyase / glyoxalase I family protein [Euphorbia peplus]